MKKRKLLFTLLMAIVMVAMSPTKVWAADVTYSQTGSKAVIKFKEYYSVSGSIVDFWKTSPVLYIDGTSVLTISDLWNTTDFLSRYTSSHSENVISNEDLDKKQKEITLNNVVIGTAKLQNRSQSVKTYTTTYYIELHLTFNDKFSFYGHQIDLKDGVYARYTSSTGQVDGTKNKPTTTAYMNGYPRPANITANQHGISWEAEKYNDDTNTSGNWLIYRGTTYLGYTTYGTTSFTDTNAPCNSTNTYTVVFVPTGWTTKKDINGLNASQSVTIGHTYGDPSWTWSNDGKSATCSRTCTNTSCTSSTTNHTVSQTVTLSGGGITSSVFKQADCKNGGTTAYTAKATVGGKEYTDTKYVDDIAAGTHGYDDNGFCTGCDQYQPLDNADNGWYEIKNAGQLYSFAALANCGAKDANGNYYYKAKARLTKDIVVNKGTFDGDGNFTAEGATSTSTPRSWTPIGNVSCYFKGQFDGDGHSISGLYFNTSSDYIGFVGYTYGATIQNLGIVNGYFKGYAFVGAIIGQSNNTTIQKCWSDSKVIATNGLVGGICGANCSGSTIEDCYSSGTVNGRFAGGICGNNDLSTTVNGVEKYSSISNCYSTATVSGTNSGSICERNESNCSVTNCYAASGDLIGRQQGNEPTNCEKGVTAERFASGEICYLLNGGENGKTDGTQAWYQNIKIDEEDEDFDNHPVLKSTGNNTVYCTYGETCTDVTFNNNGGSGTPNHEYDIAWSWAEDGKTAKATHTCQRNKNHVIETVATVTSEQTLAPTCGVKGQTTYTAKVNVIGTEQTDTKTVADIPATGNHTLSGNYDDYGYEQCSSCNNKIPMPLGEADADGWYNISNAAQLTLFANKVNDGETSIKGRLANDIDMQGQTVVQIGADSEKPFHGELDGQYHAIKNLSISADKEFQASLIGHADKVTIQKLTVQGTITSSSKFASGFIGQTKNEASKIEKCISAVDIIATIAGDGTHAGFVGVANAKVELSDCAFVGSITSETGTDNCAALVGWDNSKSSAQNCYVTATFTNGICQNPLMRNNSNEFSTCYYLNDFFNADGTPLTSKQGNQITAQQLANGELCYLLNGGVDYKTDGTQAWYQKIGTDDCPVLTSAAGNTVYCVYGETCESEKTYTNTATSSTPNHTLAGDITWTWATDYKSATASYTCGINATHKPVLAATVSNKVKTDSNCGVMGTTTYTASVTIDGKAYTDTKDVQDIPATGNHTEPADFDSNGIKECTVCHADAAYQPLDPAENDWYEIKNAGQLYSFAALENGGSKSVKARLTKDIVVNKGTFDGDGNFTAEGATSTSTPRSWTPINNFQGQFDGNGYTISGLYCNTSSNLIGFIGLANGATIQKLGIVNGYIKGGSVVGAITGQCINATTIQKCWSDSKVKGDGNIIGDICGLNMSGSTIEDCYSSGTVYGTFAGGICGDNYNYTTVKGVYKYSSISNCYSTATVSGTYSGSICGYNESNCSVTNCYASTDKLIGIQEGNEPTNCEKGVTAERFASGEICYKLNGSRSVGTDESPLVWYQTKTKDNAPKFKGMVIYYDAEKDPAYYNIATKPGDIYIDDEINISDLTLLIKLLNDGGTITNEFADVDGNGSVNIDDVNALRKKILENLTPAYINGEKKVTGDRSR